MRKAVTVIGVISVVLLGSGLALTQGPESTPMTFFITSNGSGEGAIWGVSPEPTRSVRGWRPTWMPATVPGERTSARKAQTRSMRGTVSARAHGITRRVL